MESLKALLVTETEIKDMSMWVPTHFRFGSWNHCFYCGEVPLHQDHVIPWSMWRVDKRRGGAGDSPGPRTPACAECNGRLGASFFDTLTQRASYANQKLRRKYSKLLHLEVWQPWEVTGLSGTLRKFIESKQVERNIAVRRASWQCTPDFTGLHELAWTQALADFPTNIKFLKFMRPPWVDHPLEGDRSDLPTPITGLSETEPAARPGAN